MSLGENSLITKLKQTIIQRQYGHKFSQMMNSNTRLNKDDKIMQIEGLSNVNALLPAISNGKAAIAFRTKSQSAKRLPLNPSLEKGQLQRSIKKLPKDRLQRQDNLTNKKIDLEGILVKKQSILENSGAKSSSIRTKIFSLKTPTKQQERSKNITGTKDITINRSNLKASEKNIIIKEFLSKVQKLDQQFLLTIKKGKIDPQINNNKKVFLHLQKLKKKGERQYSKFQKTLNKITNFIDRFRIQDGSIELKSIFHITQKSVLSNYQIVNLFTNSQQIIKNHPIIGLQYYTNPEIIGHQLAANRIISFFKMIFSKRFYGKFKSLLGKVLIIQKYWRMCLMTRRARRNVLQSINNKIYKHSKLQQSLIKNWPIMKTSNRFQMHICSYSLEQFKRLTIKNIQQRQNNQITRVFKAIQTDVNIIYVTPCTLHQQIMRYYSSIYSFSPTHIQEKIYFVVPENKDRLSDYNLTLCSSLLYSPKALKRIKQIVGQQYAYIVPSFPSTEYINLSAELNMPILGFNQNLSKLYSTKSGCLKILRPVSLKQKPPFYIPKTVESIFSQKELINSLAILIYKHKHIKKWYLKIEDQIQSRGLAYLNINKISFIRQLCSNESELDNVEESQMLRLIAAELSSKLRIRLKILNKDVYSDYDQFISHFFTRGGIIQAGVQGDNSVQFSISFFIDPSGQFSIIGTYNKLQLGGKSISQAIKFPSFAPPNVDYQLITRNIYKELYMKHRYFGYFTADFITSDMFILPYAIGLDCFLNEKTSSIFMAKFCCQSKYNKDSNQLTNTKQEQLHYIYCPSITLLKMPAINPFFKACKFENISFDLEKKLGTIFLLLDKLQNQQIGILCVDKSLVLLLKEAKHIIDFFSKNYRESKSSHDQIGLLKGTITTWLKKVEVKKINQEQNLV